MLKIRLLREAGGMGDVIRTFSVAQALKKSHYPCHITMVTLECYHPLYRHCNSIDDFVLIPAEERRLRFGPHDPTKYPYLKGCYDWTIDLWCPALLHEQLTRGTVTKDRIQLFCEAAGAKPERPIYQVEPQEQCRADDYIEHHGLYNKPRIAIAPLSNDRRRNWFDDKWLKLIEKLSADFHIIIFDSNKNQRASRLGGTGHHFFGHSYPEIAALLSKCHLLITVDTGPFHLAGALSVPTIGFFAPTNGELMKRWYPTHKIITPRGYEPGKRAFWHYEEGVGRITRVGECLPPCYFYKERGLRPCCFGGCALMKDIFVEDVYGEVQRIPSSHPAKTPL